MDFDEASSVTSTKSNEQRQMSTEGLHVWQDRSFYITQKKRQQKKNIN